MILNYTILWKIKLYLMFATKRNKQSGMLLPEEAWMRNAEGAPLDASAARCQGRRRPGASSAGRQRLPQRAGARGDRGRRVIGENWRRKRTDVVCAVKKEEGVKRVFHTPNTRERIKKEGKYIQWQYNQVVDVWSPIFKKTMFAMANM